MVNKISLPDEVVDILDQVPFKTVAGHEVKDPESDFVTVFDEKHVLTMIAKVYDVGATSSQQVGVS